MARSQVVRTRVVLPQPPPAHVPAREPTAGLAALDASYRPDQVGSPWTIPARGFFTDTEHQTIIHIVFTQPINPSWTPPAG